MKTIVASVLLLALAGCTAKDPNAASMIGNADIGANTARRGTPEFCERYARQTESNVYGTNRSNDENPELQARVSGQDAYKRCLAGRTS